MAKAKVITPSHRSVLQRGIRTADDYLRLVQVLIWDVSNKLVPVEYAQRLIRFMMPDRLRSITLAKKQTDKLRRELLAVLGTRSPRRSVAPRSKKR
ncbi:MAG TPA: hypothetical protein VK672_07525 [Solirubrobacteraceae bacterium]|jgi:hypothetical protein|nr:hypothetical protein [Solirubrobacteraceae bacterium]